jgi:nuclear pore complex protein Nup155
MSKIKGTKEGRIFLCGEDGNLYELVYEKEDTWLNKKIRKINHSQKYFGFLK